MNAGGINLGKVTEALNEKADRGLLNIENNTDAVLAYQAPTAENNYTWYRIYKSGWVEQGGILLNLGSDVDQFVTLPITMKDTNYTLVGGLHNKNDGGAWHSHVSVGWDKTITGFTTSIDAIANSQGKDWMVSGQGDPNAVRSAIIDKMIEAGTSINYSIANLTDYIIAYQEPTSENNYTWYRVWNSGWVEQGGKILADSNNYNGKEVILPIPMANTNYNVQKTLGSGADHAQSFNWVWLADKESTSPYENTETTIHISIPSNSYVLSANWEVKGQGDATVIAEMIANNVLHNSVNTYVIETQLPTAQNNYTWYKKYSNGWVEQGGLCTNTSTGEESVVLPIEMADTNYHVIATNESTTSANGWGWVYSINKTATGFDLYSRQGTGNIAPLNAHWQVSGIYATE